MTTIRVALANLRFPASPAESAMLAKEAIANAGRGRADIVCFPECYVPGYRTPARLIPSDGGFLQQAWDSIAETAASANVGVVLGTERPTGEGLLISALVIDRNGEQLGFQDKVQLDVSEEGTYAAGTGRRLFTVGSLTFGVVICHEGWRYPETVRWAARRGAQVVFHPHFHEAAPGSYQPSTFGEPENTFHEKALLCRAAENTCFIASVNCASPGSPTTSAVIRPDGTLLCYQPYGQEGLLFADLDLDEATGFIAARLATSV